ncbi:MAG TPA: hypothetical protein VK020_14860 [Microlunatus sp.]|nr:hypothetical protein [Microlunatus sp.]
MTPLDGSELIHHLLIDLLIRIAIVAGAVTVLAVVMIVLRRRLG